MVITPMDNILINQIEKAHQEWLCALDAITSPIFLHDQDFRILRCNKAYQKYAALPYSDIIGRPYYEIFPKSDGPMSHCSHALESDLVTQGIEDEVSAEEKLFRSRGYIIKNENGEYLYSLHILEDITEQRNVEEALQHEAMHHQMLMKNSRDGIVVVNQEYKVIEANAHFADMLGYTQQEMLELYVWDFEAQMDESYIRQHFSDIIHLNHLFESQQRRKNGSVFHVEVSITGMSIDGESIAIAFIRDITERKNAEATLERANRALKTLSAVNTVLVRAKIESDFLQNVTDIITNQAGYSLAAVVYANHDIRKSILLAAGSGIDSSDYQWAQEVTWEDSPNGRLPVSIAIRTGKTQVCRNIACNLGHEGWKYSATSQGFISNIALPLIDNDNIFGVLCIYSKEENAFDDEEVSLLEELAGDLAYGIINLRSRAVHEQHSTLLRESLEQSIQTIAATVEARDPYTAGHQRRVAELAVAIARDMGLDNEQVRGIHFAAIIHDLGKIHIPAEILAKPGRLSDIEFMLIKTHPQEGYNILKEVKFPWPIAETILQHHEKLDGSGYPHRLRGDEIRLEARILSVADIVEAMYSHRPYRAAVGIKAALNEIKNGSGKGYDPRVVETCIRLFEEKRFAFKE